MKFTEAQLESVRFIDPRGQTNMESGFATRCPNPPEGNSQYGEQRLALGSSATQKPSPSS
jgi:hypothetical protein